MMRGVLKPPDYSECERKQSEEYLLNGHSRLECAGGFISRCEALGAVAEKHESIGGPESREFAALCKRLHELMQQGRARETVAEVSESLERDWPAVARAYLLGTLGTAREALGQLRGAETALRDAISVSPLPQLYQALGRVLMTRGNPEEADRILNEGKAIVKSLSDRIEKTCSAGWPVPNVSAQIESMDDLLRQAEALKRARAGDYDGALEIGMTRKTPPLFERIRAPDGGWLTFLKTPDTGIRYIVVTSRSALGIWVTSVFLARSGVWAPVDIRRPMRSVKSLIESAALEKHDKIARELTCIE